MAKNSTGTGGRRTGRGRSGRGRHAPLHPALAAAIVGGGVLLLTLTVLMAFLLVELKESGEHIESQDEKVSNVYRAGRELIEDSAPAVEEAAPLIADAGPFVRRLGSLSRDARRALESLAPAAPALAAAIRRLSPLSSAGIRLASTAIPVLESFDPAELAVSVAVIRDLASDLSEGDRLVGLVDETRALIGEVNDRGLPRKAAKSSHRLRDALGILRETLAVQRRSLRVQRQTKAIQSEALVHIESIDRKTGGTVPATSASP